MFLNLSQNRISGISAISGLTNLRSIDLLRNQIATVDLSGSNLSSLTAFRVALNPIKHVILSNATLSQSTFDVLMAGGYSHFTGIAELPGVLSLDMSGVNFAGITDLSTMYTMDDLETLLLADASNLDSADAVVLTDALASLDHLDVTGLWGDFNAESRNSLNAWDAVEGNTLVIPEPATVSLLVLGGIAVLRKRRKQ